MPEGHTIHRVALDHQRDYAGQTVRTSSPQGRFEAGAKQLDRRKLQRVEAFGKHLFYYFTRDQCLHVHLGLYGKFRRHRCPPPEPRGAVRLRLIGKQYAFDLNGPTACELISAEQRQAILDRLGADPLRADADVEAARQRVGRSRAAIGKLLLDQSVIAGVGNVYRCEVLHLLGIHPNRKGNELSNGEWRRLWETLVHLLTIGRKFNRIIVASPDEVGKSRGRMNRDERLLIYKKKRCGRCDHSVRAWEMAARRIYACDNCQT